MVLETQFAFTVPTRVLYGPGRAAEAGSEARRLGATSVLLVTDAGVRGAGCTERVERAVREAGLPCVVFDDVPVDPDVGTVDRGVGLLRSAGCDLVVVVGGGSPLCAGKGIALVATNGGRINDYQGEEKFTQPPLPVIGIPTTAGSGSEVSPAFNITDEERHLKLSIRGQACHPRVAILDPLLLRSLPPGQALVSGMDALSHAIEATWTAEANFVTDALAMEAARLIFENFAATVFTADLEARGRMLLASTMANMACGNAKLGLAHSLAQPLVGRYGLAHGLACGILLPYVMEFNLPVWEGKLARLAAVLGVVPSGAVLPEKVAAGLAAFRKLYRELGFPARLPAGKVPEEEIPALAREAYGRSQTRVNLRRSTPGDLEELYRKALAGSWA